MAARDLWVEPPPGVTVVAVSDDGVVLGSAKAGPNRPARGSHVATASFMVAERARRASGSGARSVSGRWRGLANRAMPQCSSTPWSRPTWRPSPCGATLGFEVVGTVPEAFDRRGRTAGSGCT